MAEKEPLFQTEGVVLRTTDVGDRDRMLTLLTPQYGKLSVFARSVRKITSSGLSASQLFAYGKYTLRRGSSHFYLRESSVLETFLGISTTIEGASLAAYLCEVADELTLPDVECRDMMQLVLNTLWTISENKKPLYLIKGAFEFRAAAIAGYTPDLRGCAVCDKQSLGDNGMIDVMNGRLLCSECYQSLYQKQLQSAYHPDLNTPITDEFSQPILLRRLTPAALAAIRYVLYTPAKRQFAFSVEDEGILLFRDACESYLLHHVGHGYKTLSFYKSVINEST